VQERFPFGYFAKEVVKMAVKRFLEVGSIVATHGLRGEVKVKPWCDSSDFLKQFDRLYLDPGGTKSLRLRSVRRQGEMAILKFEGIDTVEEAMPYLKSVLYMDREKASLPDGHYYIQDIIGLEVVDIDSGEVYGTIADVFETGANDVYAVRREGRPDVLIPAIKDVVISVDLSEGRMKIRPLRGLFDEV